MGSASPVIDSNDKLPPLSATARSKNNPHNSQDEERPFPLPTAEANDHRIHRAAASEAYGSQNIQPRDLIDKIDDRQQEHELPHDDDNIVPSRPATVHGDAVIPGNRDSYISTQSYTTNSTFPYASSVPEESSCVSAVEPRDATTAAVHRISTTASVPDLLQQSRLNNNPTRPHRWRRVRDWILTPASNRRKVRKNAEALAAERTVIDSHLFLRQLEWNTLPPLLLSAAFQYDEHGHRMVPVLVSQIRISVTRPNDPTHGYARRKRNLLRSTRKALRKKEKDEHMFKIVVEYGSDTLSAGHKVQWVVYRRYWDFLRLHYQFVGHDLFKKRNVGLPRLPRLHQIHRSGHNNRTWQRGDIVGRRRRPQQQHEGAGGNDTSNAMMRRWSSLDMEFNLGLENESDPAHLPDMIEDPSMFKYRALERYLYSLARALWISPQINRFCKFLEISTLGLYLSISDPNGYHGKEGYLTIVDRTDREIVRTHRDGIFCGLLARQGSKRTPKWFIVRESYLIVCAGGPHEMAIEDVFMVDSAFQVKRLSAEQQRKDKTLPLLSRASKWKPSHTLRVSNSQSIWHLKAKNSQQERQFFESIQYMAEQSIWSQEHPFGSYAPIRHHTSASWFVDGRDYFWEVSLALENAKESIYIHDWWLELYLRRPASTNHEWRLDRVLQRKAQQGVKIYIIIYKEVAVALPLYSHYTKKHLLSLSPDNIYVQRHPSRAADIFNKNNVLFWAHHEKICVVDNQVAFIGGIDLCFGRWDTYQHVVIDNGDPSLKPDNKHPQIWPGKDYSNPRILDFHTLDKPFEDNMDRTKLPRMPWHDVSIKVTGQPARDIARHFVQRWNFLRRSKATPPKRPTPLLLVKPDMTPCLSIDSTTASTTRSTSSLGNSRSSASVSDPQITGQLPVSHVCCIQLLRSVSQWSLGIQDHVEQSIQNAYVEVIENSEHFIYIENQFFVTSTQCGSTKIVNRIGDALVNRIIRAKEEGIQWRAFIVLPLVPGFQSEINDSDGSTVRLIMHCQYKSINRGPHSIFGRLRSAGINNPEEYITFYGLRNWGELDDGQLVTEQVYVHAKVLIADDRTVIIGSANINERSQLGNRDSEIAACIHDNEIVASTLRGAPAKVGAFAHSLRLRLMSEHLGLDLENAQEQKAGVVNNNDTGKNSDSESEVTNNNSNKKQSATEHATRSESSQADTSLFGRQHFEKSRNQNFYKAPAVCTRPPWAPSDNKDDDSNNNNDLVTSSSTSLTASPSSLRARSTAENSNNLNITINHRSPSSPGTMSTSTAADEQRCKSSETAEARKSTKSSTMSCTQKHKQHAQFWEKLCCDPDIDGTGSDNGDELLAGNKSNNNNNLDYMQRILRDPLDSEFINVWHTTARRNSHLFRCAFLVMPDNNVQTWDDYNEFNQIAKTCLGRKDPATSGTHKEMMLSGARRRYSQHTHTTTGSYSSANNNNNNNDGAEAAADTNNDAQQQPRLSSSSDTGAEPARAYEYLCRVQGHLVIWPIHFLEEEDEQNEFLHNRDKLAPLEIFD